MFFATVDDVSSAVVDLGTYETRAGKSLKNLGNLRKLAFEDIMTIFCVCRL